MRVPRSRPSFILSVAACLTAGVAHAQAGADCVESAAFAAFVAPTAKPLPPDLSEAACLIAGAAQAGADCVKYAAFASPTVQPLPPDRFLGISSNMPTSTILKRLGPAARDVGSGLYVLQWDVTDGRVFIISTPGLCLEHPFGVGFSPGHLSVPSPEFRVPQEELE